MYNWQPQLTYHLVNSHHGRSFWLCGLYLQVQWYQLPYLFLRQYWFSEETILYWPVWILRLYAPPSLTRTDSNPYRLWCLISHNIHGCFVPTHYYWMTDYISRLIHGPTIPEHINSFFSSYQKYISLEIYWTS